MSKTAHGNEYRQRRQRVYAGALVAVCLILAVAFGAGFLLQSPLSQSSSKGPTEQAGLADSPQYAPAYAHAEELAKSFEGKVVAWNSEGEQVPLSELDPEGYAGFIINRQDEGAEASARYEAAIAAGAIRDLGHGTYCATSLQDVQAYLALDDVSYLEPDYYREIDGIYRDVSEFNAEGFNPTALGAAGTDYNPNDPLFQGITVQPITYDNISNLTYVRQSELYRIGIQDAWKNGGNGGFGLPYVTVAVIDTGLDGAYPDINHSNVLTGKNFYNASLGTNTTDDNSHGTYCSAIIAGINNNGKGGAGIAPNVKIKPYKAGGANGKLTSSAIIASITDATETGVDVISMSFGSSTWNKSEEDACKRAVAAGIILVAAAGNDHVSTKHYPAAYECVIGCGSTGSYGNFSSGFSNYNSSTSDAAQRGADNTFVVAPGQAICLISWGEGSYSSTSNTIMNGTSFSTPTVAGVAAIAKSLNGNLTQDDFKQLIKTTSTKNGVYSRTKPAPGFSATLGWGNINAANIVDAMNANVTHTVPDLSQANVMLSQAVFYENGTVQKPSIVYVRCGGVLLREGVDYTVTWPADMRNAGKKSIVINGMGAYSGTSLETHYHIDPRSLTKATIEARDCEYTGEVVTDIEVSMFGRPLVEHVDYKVSYYSNIGNLIDPGPQKVIIEPCDGSNYTDSVAREYTINKVDIDNADVELSGSSNRVYTGSAYVPTVSATWIADIFKDDETKTPKTLVRDTDYTVTYENNIAAGTASVKLSGMGTYFTGTKTVDFEISKYGLDNLVFSMPEQAYTYTGSAITPDPLAKYLNKTLVNGTDFDVTYSDNVNVGPVSVSITGKGNFSGTNSTSFEIVPAPISEATATVPDCTYNGGSRLPYPKITFNGKDLVDGKDYEIVDYKDNINVGTATLTVEGRGNFTGTMDIPFQIIAAKIDLPECIGGLVYNGSVQQGIASHYSYDVEDGSSADAGTHLAKVTPKSGYCWQDGSTDPREVPYYIAPVSLEDARVSGLAAQTYTGSSLNPVPVLELGAFGQLGESDFDVSYEDDVNVGQATVTITGKGNFEGTIIKSYNILPASISGALVSAEPQPYTGSALEPVPFVTLEGFGNLTEDDYEVWYASNVDVGTATINIEGKGNFEGSTSGIFDITCADISGATVTIAPQTYTGAALEPLPAVTLGGFGTLEEGIDYEISGYEDNVNAGTATITIEGKGNFAGQLPGHFEISRAPVPFPVSNSDLVYNGFLQEGVPSGEGYTVDDGSAVDTGLHYAKASLDANHCWIDGGTDDMEAPFEISPASISAAVIGGLQDQVYSGFAFTPTVIVTLPSFGELTPNDYDVSYDANVNVGTATVTVTGKGNFEGSASTGFAINPAEVPNPVAVTGLVYNGAPQQGVLEATGYALSEESATNAGNYTATATLDSNHCWQGGSRRPLEVPYSIAPASIAGFEIGDVPAQTYTGQAITLGFDIYMGDAPLVRGTDYTVSYANNLNAGTATFTISGKGNFTGSVGGSFEISRAPLALPDAVSGLVYDGSLQQGVAAGDGYTVSNASATNAGSHVATLMPDANHCWADGSTGPRELPFTIAPLSIANVTLGQIPDAQYTGAAIEPLPTIVVDGVTLVKDRDYTVSFANNVNPGTATITIEGKGNYTGTCSGRFTILTPASIDNPVVTPPAENPSVRTPLSGNMVGSIVAQIYTGNAVEPPVLVRDGSKTLARGVDYTLSFKNNVNAGTARVEVTGIGAYKGMVSKEFSITPASIANIAIGSIPGSNYTGAAIEPLPTIKLGGITLVKDRDYTVSYANNVNPGMATVTITGKGNYAGTRSASFTISKAPEGNVPSVDPPAETPSVQDPSIENPPGDDQPQDQPAQDPVTRKPLTKGMVSGFASYIYTGGTIEPKVTVRDGSTLLVRGVDYRVSYKNNVHVGTARVEVTGIGEYEGAVTRDFAITQAGLSNASVSFAAPATYTGAPVTPQPKVVLSGYGTLIADRDYTLSYANNVNVGTGTVTITGKGDYSGSKTSTFAIVRADLSNASIAPIAAQEWTGSSIEPDVVITLDGKQLVKGTDYTLDYVNNKNVGTAWAYVTGKGIYRGSARASFVIKQADSRTAKVEISASMVSGISDMVYTGKDITHDVIVRTADGKRLAEGTDYDLSYEGNAEVGKASVVISGKGSYMGNVRLPFEISHAATPAVFPDLKSDAWYLNEGWEGSQVTYLDYVVAHKIISGYANGKFGPDDEMTRGMAATILYRAATGKTADTTDNDVNTRFADVRRGEWYAAAIAWADSQGIVTGYAGTDRFDPEAKVSRQALATMIARYAGWEQAGRKPIDPTAGIPAAGSAALSAIPGASEVDSWAIAGMRWCAEKGVMGGVTMPGGAKQLQPDGTATRAAMAKMAAVTMKMYRQEAR